MTYRHFLLASSLSVMSLFAPKQAEAIVAGIKKDSHLVVVSGVLMSAGFGSLLATCPSLVCSGVWFAKGHMEDLEHPLTEEGADEKSKSRCWLRLALATFVGGTTSIAASITTLGEESHPEKTHFKALDQQIGLNLGLTSEAIWAYNRDLDIINAIADEILSKTFGLPPDEALKQSEAIWTANKDLMSARAWGALIQVTAATVTPPVLQPERQTIVEPSQSVMDQQWAADAVLPHADLVSPDFVGPETAACGSHIHSTCGTPPEEKGTQVRALGDEKGFTIPIDTSLPEKLAQPEMQAPSLQETSERTLWFST
jgi:hypothetical protein